MSELTATTVCDAYWKANSVGEGTGVQVYFKSETDKVIAELKDKLRHYPFMVAMLEHDKLEILGHKDIIRHQKYKRCLAMANLCAKTVDHLNSEGYIYEKEGRADEVNDCIKGTEFYHKWYERWLKIAEQFEEVK